MWGVSTILILKGNFKKINFLKIHTKSKTKLKMDNPADTFREMSPAL